MINYYDVWRLPGEREFDSVEVRNLLVMKCELADVDYEPELLFDKDTPHGGGAALGAGAGEADTELAGGVGGGR